MAELSCFACLGRPVLVGSDSEPVAVKTRKALAIIGFLCRMSDLSSPRTAISDLLWSQADRQKALQSLRQALRQLKAAEKDAGLDIVKSTNAVVQLDSASFHTDLDELLQLLKRGTADDFNEAKTLWRGEFLSGYEDLDHEFEEWLLVERERVQSQIITETLKHLEASAVEEGRKNVESAAQFLLHIDPALEIAHQVLIRYFLALGQRERAEQQFKNCERELKLHLDEEPGDETRELLDVPEAYGQKQLQIGRQPSEVVIAQAGRKTATDQIVLPNISIMSSQLNKTGLNEAINLKEEIVAGLSSYRSFDLYDSGYFSDGEAPGPTLIQGDELGSYLLRFQYNERSDSIAIQFEDRADGRIVFNDIVDLELWDSVQAAASHTISRVHLHSIGKLRNPANNTAFAKWCQAESLMWEFDLQSDKKALHLLNEIEKQHSSFSMIFSGKALINMKQLIHYPVSDQKGALGLNEILSLSEQAVVLDPWQPLNQRAYGWALTQAGMKDQARSAFLNAGRLNSVDPSNLMSVAEGLAFSGDVGMARQKADQAMRLFTAVPRVFYEYYSNVFFAAEDFETSAQLMERSSFTTISGLITRVAALVCAGREAEALEVLTLYSDTYAEKIQNTGLGQGDPNEWARRINFFQEPISRDNYEKGVDLVRRFFFGGRASIS
ncbi:MAG: BTAD domain-containing putative transcriptional regulator [Roseibium sp.]